MKKLLLLIFLALFLTSCNAISAREPSNSQSHTSALSKEALSPFTQFENLKTEGSTEIDGEQVDKILRLYGIFDSLQAKVNNEGYAGSFYTDVGISGFSVGEKKAAVLSLTKGHLYIYVMFSNSHDKWVVDGFVYQNEKDKPDFRIERSGDGTMYWLVLKHEANHGTGLQLYEEIWYSPDGSIAAEFPAEGSTLFFPENINPEANAYFSCSPYYDGASKISLSYSISFEYGYKDNYQNNGTYTFQSKYRPVVRENWEYDLKTEQLKFVSCDPALSETLIPTEHTTSPEYGILQGYIDFYGTRLEDNKINTLDEWEKFMDLK